MSIVQTANVTSASSVSSTTATFGATVTAGNTVLVVVTCLGAVSTVSDDKGNSYTNDLNATFASGFNQVSVWRFYNPTNSPISVTINLSSVGKISAEILEVQGILSSPIDQFNSNSGASGTASGIAITTLHVPDFALASLGLVSAANSLISTPSGFTPSYSNINIGNPSGEPGIDVEYRFINVTETPNPTWTFSSTSWGDQLVLYKLVTPTPPQLPQPSQQLFAFQSPDYWQEWEAFTQPPQAAIYVPPRPTTYQASQRIDPLPVHDSWWEQWRYWPVPVSYIPTPPPTHQASQQVNVIPDYWQEWEAYRQNPYAGEYVVLPIRTALTIRWDVPPVLDSWWEQFRRWPIPTAFTPTPDSPLPHQANQELYFDLPDYDYTRYEPPPQFRWQQLPSTFIVMEEGVSGIANVIGGVMQVGISRVQNSVDLFVVYVGINTLPDLTQPASIFAVSLPINIPTTPPPSGTKTYYILVRKQDTYGLQSQNQFYSTITIDSSGNQVFPPVETPQGSQLMPAVGDLIRIVAFYPNQPTDPYPATSWKIWAGATPPNPSVDTPVATVPVTSQTLSANIGPYASGLWYVTLGLYRSVDNALSPTVSGSVVIPLAPTEVVAVPSGFDVEP